MNNQHSKMVWKTWLTCLLLTILTPPGVFAATLTFDTVAPAPTADAISNFVGAGFDADNVGGSGVNANGSPNNGTANDGTTYVATNQPVQGQTFTTGTNAGGYTITSITVRAGGYSNNTATGTNGSSYGLTNTTVKSFRIRVGRISGTTFIPYTIEYAPGGGSGNPGAGQTASGPGTYLTFTFKAPIVLQPNTVYAFDLGGNGNYFEMLGIRDAASGGNPYAAGTAYTSGANGSGSNTITTLTGERVFQINLTAYTPSAPGVFVHPGLLNDEADFERMRTKTALGIEPWASAYAAMDDDWTSRQAGTWVPHPAVTVIRGGAGENFGTFANDIAVAYGSALRWKVSGDTAYAEQAILILNAHATTMTGIGGDPNFQLLHINGYQFACAAEIMRSYSGWAPADFEAFRTMMKSAFAPSAQDFLIRHMGQGYSYMWGNWDLCTMDSLYALGVLCDDTNLTTVATDYFYNGLGEGCIDRTVNFIHPGHLGQTQEAGRDQGHNTLEIALLAPFCEMAWHQGVDLYGHHNNRVLAGAEYVAKYNLGYDVPFSLYAQETGFPYPTVSTQISAYQRGGSRNGWEIIYNHYVNRKGLAAPWSAAFAAQMRPTVTTGQDQPGFDTMSASLDPIATGANPSGLTAIVTAQQPVLSWWGSAYATGYNVKRTTTSGSNYTAIATGVTNNTFTDTNVISGATYYYVVSASLVGGGETGNSSEAAAILGTSLFTHLKFDESSGTNAADFTGNNWSGALVNGPTWTTGKSNNAVNLASASSQYVSLPSSVVSDLSDFSISAWVYLNSVTTFSRIFDFGTGTERYMFLTPQAGGGKVRFAITGCGGLGEQQINGTAALPASQWVHVAVALHGTVATLYVNGLAVGQNLNMTMTPSRLPATTNNWIGRSQFGGDPYLNGKVDDFRIYRGPLTAAAAYTLATGLTPPAVPAAPASLTATALPGNQIALSWPASVGATSYTVRRATVSGGPYTTITSLVTGTNYTDTGLTAGTNYFYVISAANAGGDGANSPQANAVALPPMPSVPTGLTAFASSSSAITLDWADAANALIYNVKRSLTNGGPYTTIATGVLVSTFTDTGRSAGTTYYYVVSSENVAGESANSAQDSAAPSDLLLHLRLDEITGTAAADSSGNGFPATTVNAPTWTAGKINNALTFASASSQYATLPSGVVSTLNDFTVCAWVKVNTFGTFARIFDFGTSTANYMFLTPQYTGTLKPRFAIRTAAVAEQVVSSSIALTAGTWTHIAVAQSSNTVTFYINGAVAGSNTGVTLRASSLGSTTLNYLGRSQFADPYLNGSLDDFRIYSRALLQSEITTFQTALAAPQNLTLTPSVGPIGLTWSTVATATSYTLKRATSSGGPYMNVASALGSTAYTDTTTTAGGIHYYVVTATKGLVESTNSNEVVAFAGPIAPRVYLRFDEASGTTATDSSSNGWNGTLAGAATFAAGTINNAVRLPGASADRVTLPVGVVSGLGDFTISAWMKVNSFATFSRVFDFGTSTTNYMFLTPQYTGTAPNNAKPRFAIRTPAVGEQQISSAIAITAGTWNHVAVTLSGVTATLYVNGAAVGTNTAMTLTPSSLGSTTQNYLGDSQFSADPSLNGFVDDFRIYNRAFTAGEIGILQTQLAAPTALAATPASGQVLLTWNSVSNASSYTLNRATTGGGPHTAIAQVDTTSFTDTNVSNGTAYYYVVRAANIAGESGDSAQASATPYSANVVWAGGVDGSWDVNTTANWQRSSPPFTYLEGDAVRFDDTATGSTTVNLMADVLPASVTVSNVAKNFAFTGSGVAGLTSLTKFGTGTLTLNNANSYSGGTTIDGGTLLVNNVGGSGTGSGLVTVVSGTLGGNGIINGAVTVQSGATLALGNSIGTLTINNNLTLGGNLAVEVNKSASPSSDLCIVSGTLTNAGTGWLTVANLGPALAIGDSFMFFNQPMQNGGALTITPAPGPGLAWTNKLAIDGTIAVVTNGPATYTERIYAVTTANQLISFQSTTPGTILSSVFISGLQGSEQILGVDFVGDTLYAVGNSSRLYTVIRVTGVATLVGQFTPVISGSWAGVEAEPAGIRVLTDLDQQLVLNPGNGAATAGATLLGSPNPTITGLAYHPGTGVRYVADYVQNTIGTLDPLTGLVTPIGATTIDFSRNNGFDISGRSAYTAYLASPAASSDPAANFYRVDLTSGAAKLVGLVGLVGDNTLIRGLAVGPGYVELTPTNLTYNPNGNQLTLSWPMDHTGWRLQTQTNSRATGLSTNWFDVSDSSLTNSVVVPVDAGNGSVFYRLVYP